MHNASTKKVPPESAAATVGLSVLLEYEVLVWALGLFAFHGVVQFACSRVQSPLQAKPGVVAHQAAILPAFLFAAVRGTTAFLRDDHLWALARGTYADRLYSMHAEGFALTKFMLGFQLYDLMATALEPSLRKAEHLGHHVATLCTALSSLTIAPEPFAMFYCVFFFGFIEVSSVPLAFVDLFRQLPELTKTPAGASANEAARTLFGVTFLASRGVAFPLAMALGYWPDLYRGGTAVAPAVVLWLFVSSAFLTFLQLFWSSKILRVILSGNRAGEADTSKED